MNSQPSHPGRRLTAAYKARFCFCLEQSGRAPPTPTSSGSSYGTTGTAWRVLRSSGRYGTCPSTVSRGGREGWQQFKCSMRTPLSSPLWAPRSGFCCFHSARASTSTMLLPVIAPSHPHTPHAHHTHHTPQTHSLTHTHISPPPRRPDCREQALPVHLYISAEPGGHPHTDPAVDTAQLSSCAGTPVQQCSSIVFVGPLFVALSLFRGPCFAPWSRQISQHHMRHCACAAQLVHKMRALCHRQKVVCVAAAGGVLRRGFHSRQAVDGSQAHAGPGLCLAVCAVPHLCCLLPRYIAQEMPGFM